MSTQSAYEDLVRRAAERSERLGDPCKHLTRCADAACSDRMIASSGSALVGVARPDR